MKDISTDEARERIIQHLPESAIDDSDSSDESENERNSNDEQSCFMVDNKSLLNCSKISNEGKTTCCKMEKSVIDENLDGGNILLAIPEECKIHNPVTDTNNETAIVDKNSIIMNVGNDGIRKEKDDTKSNSNSLTILNTERQLATFSSAATDYYSNRTFQGLVPNVPENHLIGIVPGQYGIASTYVQNEIQSLSTIKIEKDISNDNLT